MGMPVWRSSTWIQIQKGEVSWMKRGQDLRVTFTFLFRVYLVDVGVEGVVVVKLVAFVLKLLVQDGV